MKACNPFGCSVFFLFTVLLFIGCKDEVRRIPQTYTVEIKAMQFVPENLTIHKGDTVIWVNKDMVAHDVTEEKKAWTSSALASEASWKKVITKSEKYYCSIHVVMKGTLVVED